MNNLSLFTLLVLIYLGLSKSFSPSEKRNLYVVDEAVLPSLFRGSPLSLILEDSFQTGFLIKTYFLKFKIIYGGLKTPRITTVRTSYKFWKQNQKNIGLSLFRREERDSKISWLPLPPGSLYIGDPAYGRWKLHNSGDKFWKFHQAYKNFPKELKWGKFRPSIEFFEKMQDHISNNIPFYGLNKNFGTEGAVTKLAYPRINDETPILKFNLKKHMVKFIYIPTKKTSKSPPRKKHE